MDGTAFKKRWFTFTVELSFFVEFKADRRFCFLKVQQDMPKSSALVAGKRQFDVYLGIDVFGRGGQYGGGKWTVITF